MDAGLINGVLLLDLKKDSDTVTIRFYYPNWDVMGFVD
jgi:hypothetical protein